MPEGSLLYLVVGGVHRTGQVFFLERAYVCIFFRCTPSAEGHLVKNVFDSLGATYSKSPSCALCLHLHTRAETFRSLT